MDVNQTTTKKLYTRFLAEDYSTIIELSTIADYKISFNTVLHDYNFIKQRPLLKK